MNREIPRQLSFAQVSGEWTQRWSKGVPTWKHPDQGGFDRRHYEITESKDDRSAAAFVTREHYLQSYPAALHRFFLLKHGNLEGVAVFGAPSNVRTLTNPFPDLAPYYESCELSRFVLSSACESNAETFFLWHCLRHLRRDGLRGVVAFSDPVARQDAQGHIIFAGHAGHIYRVGSALFAGRGTARTLLLLPNGQPLNDRSLQKIRTQEKGHEGVEELLHRFGATPRAYEEDPRAWLSHALDTIHVRRLRHPGNYRFLFDLSGRVQRQRLGLPTLPYPS